MYTLIAVQSLHIAKLEVRDLCSLAYEVEKVFMVDHGSLDIESRTRRPKHIDIFIESALCRQYRDPDRYDMVRARARLWSTGHRYNTDMSLGGAPNILPY